ncbi:MAG: ADP-ribosylglycohydrolase family protein [Dehalococcoidia bacterium]|nr:ADP-ribosylglycohydrolase family protein [Dehalococcoidia bacterium]
MDARERILGGLWGAVVGDALGVPVEFQSRNALLAHPVIDMRGEGTYQQPPGTWSDDTSLMLCTVEELIEGFDTQRLGKLFVRWLNSAYWTPRGRVFDVGITTRQAINRLSNGAAPEQAGLDDENSNGNGSLMRILPVALRFSGSSTAEIVNYAHQSSSLTHRHLRSKVACGIYCLIARALMSGRGPADAYEIGIQESRAFYLDTPYSSELSNFERVLSGQVGRLPESAVASSGYVVHTLEASIWCLLNTGSFRESTLRAVNLGEDTDTTATVTGGLAGIYYGVSSIPDEWLHQLARREDLGRLFENFHQRLESSTPDEAEGEC